MATYDDSSLSNAQLSHKSPLTIQKARALRDNPVAMFEGAPGAPRLELPALERLVAGDVVRSSVTDASVIGLSTVWVTVLAFGFLQIGTIRCKTSASQARNTRVVRTRAGASTIIVGATSTAALSADVSVLPGDGLEIQAAGASDITAYLISASLCVEAGNLWPGAAANVTGNAA